MQEQAYTLDQFLAAYRIGRTTAFEEIKSGRLVVSRVGRRLLISRQRADEWLASCEQPVQRAA